jgi:hypothetical protein
MKKAILIDTKYAVMATYVDLPENSPERYQQSLSFLKATRLEFVGAIGDIEKNGDTILCGVTSTGDLTGMYLISNDNGNVNCSPSEALDLFA